MSATLATEENVYKIHNKLGLLEILDSNFPTSNTVMFVWVKTDSGDFICCFMTVNHYYTPCINFKRLCSRCQMDGQCLLQLCEKSALTPDVSNMLNTNN